MLRAEKETPERRPQRPAQRHIKPHLIATAPNQVWTWDITKLPPIVRGIYLSLYVNLDLFSRYIVGWMVSRKENAGLARDLFSRALAHHAIRPGTLIVHQDRGSPMIVHRFVELMTDLGVARSYSRPRVTCNDLLGFRSIYSESSYFL